MDRTSQALIMLELLVLYRAMSLEIKKLFT